MHKTIRLSLLVVLNAVALVSHAFEYRIISNVADSTLDGSTLTLENITEWRNDDVGIVQDGIIDIKGESTRSFPAVLKIKNKNTENRKPLTVLLIVEPGSIVVHPDSLYSISGGVLNSGMKDLLTRSKDAESDEEAQKLLIEVLQNNVGNGLGEYALFNYGWFSSPEEWTQAVSMVDEDTRNLPAIDDITARKRRLSPVWEGQPFKDLQGTDINGSPVNLSDYVGKGKYVVADFWASWCGGCIVLARKVLKPLYEKYKNRPDVQFLGVATDDISKAVDKHGISWPQIMSCKKLMGTYVVNSIPEVVIFGPDGTILRRYTQRHIESILEELLD